MTDTISPPIAPEMVVYVGALLTMPQPVAKMVIGRYLQTLKRAELAHFKKMAAMYPARTYYSDHKNWPVGTKPEFVRRAVPMLVMMERLVVEMSLPPEEKPR